MNLRQALDFCSVAHRDDWVRLPGERPATAIIAGLFDAGAAEPRTSILTGHTIAVYEPDPRLSLVWPVPDDDPRDERDRATPEWLENEEHDWKHSRDGWAVVLLDGAPIWQELISYLDWGSGVGGHVAYFEPRFADSGTRSSIEGWNASKWSIDLARLINTFSASGDFGNFDPTQRVVPNPSDIHPVDAERRAY